jgi:ribokinase
MKVAVVGHVEWGRFAHVERIPKRGEIVHAELMFELAAGGGPVAAVQLRKLAGNCTFYTALGDDELGHRALRELSAMGVRVAAVFRDEPQRQAFVHVDATGERTITVMGSRLGPRGTDDLPWDEIDDLDAVYFCAGDDVTLAHARRAKVLVATTREAERVARAGLELDAVVGSATDPAETYIEADPPPALIVETQGAKGGRYRGRDGRKGRFAPGTLRGETVCTYGAGDSFAAALTFALGGGLATSDALRLAAECGAAVLRRPGPYIGQLTSDELPLP